MAVGYLTLWIKIPGCSSLKEKRGRLKPLLARLHREFNISAAELERHDDWQDSVIGCALVSNDRPMAQKALHSVAEWVDEYWPDVTLVEEHVEIIL